MHDSKLPCMHTHDSASCFKQGPTGHGPALTLFFSTRPAVWYRTGPA